MSAITRFSRPELPAIPVLLLILSSSVAQSTQDHQLSSSYDNGSGGTGGGFGDPCSLNDVQQFPGPDGCDSSAFLKCDNFRCDCATLDMLYNETLAICVVFANRSCDSNPNCVANAHCTLTPDKPNDKPTCICQAPAYRFHIGGVCLLWHHEPCSRDGDCHFGAHLKCMDPIGSEHSMEPRQDDSKKVCECNPESHTWRSDLDTCVGLHGTQCLEILGEKCVENASCNWDQVCDCDSGFSATPNKTCLRSFGSSCDNSTRLCNHHGNLNCSDEDQQCRCLNPNLMEFHEEDEKCYVRLGQSCQLTNDCVPNAECDLKGQGGQGQAICRCRDGHFQTGLGACERAMDSGGGGSFANYNYYYMSLSLGLLSLV